MTEPVYLEGEIASPDGAVRAWVTVEQASSSPTPPTLPDLIVTAGRVVDPEPDLDGTYPAGAPLLCAATVRNEGTRILPGTIIGVAFYFGTPDPARLRGVTRSDRPDPRALACWCWSDTYTDGLETGAELELTANGGFAGATFPAAGPTLAIEARVDDTSDVSRILESNEANNRYRFEITVADPPEPEGPPPGSSSPASAQLTVGDFPTDGPDAPEWLGNFMAPLQADGARRAPGVAQNLGGSDPNEFMSRAWGIASNDPEWGQDWIRRGQLIGLTVPIAFPPPGVAYGNVTDAQKRDALFATAAGANDGTFRTAAAYFTAAAADAGTLIDSRVGHEPDATWYCWSIAGGIDAYHAAARHVVPLWRELVPGTSIVANMNGALDRNLAWSSVPWGTGQSQTELIFGPLEELEYDVVAGDIYYSANDPGFTDPERKMTFLLEWSNAWGVPACVPEWGLDSVDWPDAIDHWRSMVERFADGQFLYHCYFDGWPPASLSTKPATRARFYSLDGFGT